MADRILGSRWIKFWFALSTTAFVGLQIYVPSRLTYINLAIAALNILAVFALTLYFERKYSVLGKFFEKKSAFCAVISFGIATYAVYKIPAAFTKRWLGDIIASNNTILAYMRNLLPQPAFEQAFQIVLYFACIVALFSVFAAAYAAVSRLRPWAVSLWKGADKAERLYCTMAVSVLFCLIAYIYSQTSVASGVFDIIDILFDMDSNRVLPQRAVTYFGNYTIVQRILYTQIHYPITLVVRFFIEFVSYTPFSPFREVVGSYVLQALNASLMIAGAILLSRMCGVKGASKAFFVSGYSLMYSFLVFSFAIETYILSTFSVIFLVYAHIHKLRAEKIAVPAAAGVLTTNAVFIPFLSYSRDIRTWIANAAKYSLALLIIWTYCGNLAAVPDIIPTALAHLDVSGGTGVTWGEKALQYLAFISSCFIRPETTITINNNGNWQYHLAPAAAFNWQSVLGIVLIALTIVSFISNRKSRFAQIAFFWASFSFALLFLLGFQSTKNEMFLCSLYFGWAFYSLIFMLIEKLPAKYKMAKYAVYSALLAAFAAANIPGIVDIVRFGIEYYPLTG